MTVRIFATLNEDGTPSGFYPSDVCPTPPAGAVEISPDDWREFLDYQGYRRWDGHRVVEFTPPPAAPTPPPPWIVKLAQESQAMNEAIVSAVRAWAGLENALAYLLGTIITQGGGSLGMAIYYRPSATETRIAIVDEAIIHFCAVHSDGASVKVLWTKLHARIGNSKSTRNKIIHGNVVTHGTAKGRNHIRLTAPIFDASSKNRDLVQSIETARHGGSRAQLPGMSVNDVRNSARNFSELGQMVAELRLIMSHMQRVVPEPASFQKKFQTLADHLKTTDHPSAKGGTASAKTLS
jgi:hypothetical protein